MQLKEKSERFAIIEYGSTANILLQVFIVVAASFVHDNIIALVPYGSVG